jgi:hypothetical protein
MDRQFERLAQPRMTSNRRIRNPQLIFPSTARASRARINAQIGDCRILKWFPVVDRSRGV